MKFDGKIFVEDIEIYSQEVFTKYMLVDKKVSRTVFLEQQVMINE